MYYLIIDIVSVFVCVVQLTSYMHVVTEQLLCSSNSACTCVGLVESVIVLLSVLYPPLSVSPLYHCVCVTLVPNWTTGGE